MNWLVIALCFWKGSFGWSRYSQLWGSILLGICMLDEVRFRIQKFWLAFANMGHLWHQCDVQLYFKGRVYTTYSEPRPLRTEHMRRISVFEHTYPHSIYRKGWQIFSRNSDVRRSVGGFNGPIIRRGIEGEKTKVVWVGFVPVPKNPVVLSLVVPSRYWLQSES